MEDIGKDKFDLRELYQKNAKRFLSLPFEDLPEAGALLMKFSDFCIQGIKEQKSPREILDQFFKEVARVYEEKEQIELLFWFLQFIERQVVLFDAIEDAIFEKTHKENGRGTLKYWLDHNGDTAKSTIENYRIRLVLTAHPTQFYPSQVIGILQDLTVAVGIRDEKTIGDLLLQMARTSFLNAHKPTPLDEALFLCQYLDNVFYPTLASLQQSLNLKFGDLPSAIEIGFWPGGDRDGNSNVTTKITEEVLRLLHQRILNKYLAELEDLKHRLTFKHVFEILVNVKARLQVTIQQKSSDPSQKPSVNGLPYSTSDEFMNDLMAIKKIVDEEHGGLYSDNLQHLMSAVTCFGFYYAALDIRQDSLVHSQLIHEIFQYLKVSSDYLSLSDDEKLNLLQAGFDEPVPSSLTAFKSSGVNEDTVNLFCSLKRLQGISGEYGLNRYVISHTQSANHVLEVMLLLYWFGFGKNTISMNIVPLFESIEDLHNALTIMKQLYENKYYSAHLKSRNNTQTIMLGYSDGTKDGGYLTANWAIYQAKASLAKLSDEYSVNYIFFDGRGGPPSRGGGNTHKFYRALVGTIPQQELQLTLQGQTISTNFGTLAAAHYHVAQLYTAGLATSDQPIIAMSHEDTSLLDALSASSSESYQNLIHHPKFIPFLENMTPLNYFGELNIASRPPRRDKKGPLNLDNCRAITYVSSWSQMKINVPGFYGFGTALQKMIDQGRFLELQNLYKRNLYFHTLVENAMQSLLKNFLPLTHYLSKDSEYGEFLKMLAVEAKLTEAMLLKITEQPYLLADDPKIRTSIQIRESIVLPLQIIQQAILMKLRASDLSKDQREVYKKLLLKTLPINLNASRNSA